MPFLPPNQQRQSIEGTSTEGTINYTGCKILKRFTWPWPRPFQGIFFIGRVGLAMESQCTKFEVSRFTHYDAMNGGANAENGVVWAVRGHSKSTAMSRFDRAHTTSYSTLIETMRLSCTVFEIQLVICGKSPILTHPTCIWCPRRGWPRSNFAEIFVIRKTRVPGLSCGVVCVILSLAVLVELWLVTDRQTDTGPWLVPRMHSIAR